MKLNVKYNALKIDEIEQTKKLPIEECLQDTSINNIALFIQKGYVNDNGTIGTSRSVAMDIIDKYLQENEKTDLVFDIMEALVEAGFLTKELNVAELRGKVTEKSTQIKDKIDNL